MDAGFWASLSLSYKSKCLCTPGWMGRVGQCPVGQEQQLCPCSFTKQCHTGVQTQPGQGHRAGGPWASGSLSVATAHHLPSLRSSSDPLPSLPSVTNCCSGSTLRSF